MAQLLSVAVLIAISTQAFAFMQGDSFDCYAAAHPHVGCRFKNSLVLHTSDGHFAVHDKGWKRIAAAQASSLVDMFDLRQADSPYPKCDKNYDEEVYMFTYYQLYGNSNYYHLHTDTVFPLFQELESRGHLPSLLAGKATFLNVPVANVPRTKDLKAPVDWDAKYFVGDQKKKDQKYWEQVITVWGDKELELNTKNFRTGNKLVCFTNVTLGLPRYGTWQDATPEGFIDRFVLHVRQLLKLTLQPQLQRPYRIGLVSRNRGRRGITNAEEIVAAAKSVAEVEYLEFSGKTYRQQVNMMSNYAVVIAMNGAGFMNTIYLPPGAVAVQMVPFNGTNVNWHQFGEIVENRGPYMVYFNNHPLRTTPDFKELSRNEFRFSQADTTVHPGEFVEIIRDAISMIGQGVGAKQPERSWSTMAPMPCWRD